MHVLYSDRHELHQPKSFLLRGRIVDLPETAIRASSIAAALREAGHRVGSPDDLGVAPREAVHTRDYLDFLATIWDRWQALPGTGPEIIANIHPGRHMAHRPEGTIGLLGWHTADTACPIVAGTWDAAVGAANAAAAAAALVREGERVAYALCRPPGHHAYADMAGGFCYLNNTAIAAAALRQRFARVAVLDIDVHHGNGTQGIFWERADVLTVSIHADPAAYYPWYAGYADERGAGAGEGFNLNLPLPHGSGDPAMLAAVDSALGRVHAFDPEALVVALGFDAHENDPLGVQKVTTGGFAEIARRIARLGRPTVLVQEGGYGTADLPRNALAFLAAFEAP
jgi:acetoin utilization deacetylase AcuC-like enzyme